MKKVETETGKMVAALRDGLHGLHVARMALVAEARALRLAGRRAEREKVWARGVPSRLQLLSARWV